ncbi:cysteine synthase family protein [Plantactinospora endophytica]|uniref:2,3-diaminopropionate biosynthesis protein SbnA n=1 Tax=Plantactinospora endophytica TaxID=673535 RepID=A0ABQ4DVZ3_9ACTN|nr:cysteine synthase family protein [Plantactinospora endophytica]GIG86267.1 2,3-diaminopropionate biosynthesis protein SbnA [Plantactinospora endophytica]
MKGRNPFPGALAAEPTIGGTPVRRLRVPVGGRSVRLWLKLEAENPFGSIKARTAAALLDALEATDELRPGRRVVESTSGNLGVALAGLCRARGYPCTLVVEPSTPRAAIDRMVDYGAEVITAGEIPGGTTLDARLAAVREILDRDDNTVWTNQYASPANPRVHEAHTAVELVEAAPDGGYDAVAVAVSTGGTLAGIATHLRRHSPATKVIAVDAVGSAAMGGTPGDRPYKLAGFGSGRVSDFVRRQHWDSIVRLRDVDAAAACTRIRWRTGLFLGGSGGAAVLAAVVRASLDPALRELACVCPDSGDKYPRLNEAIPADRRTDPAPGFEPATADDPVTTALDLLDHISAEGE